jgi:YegS/Rv2252/BmrU family lipid kinase
MVEWIPVIVNPAAGQRATGLKKLDQVFQAAGVHWSVDVTQGEGDAFRLAQQAADQGAEIVAVYGGDGTVSEAATALASRDTALAILPGGTGNVLAYEFNTPRDYLKAARLLTGEHQIRVVDLGQVGNRKFLIRAGVGLESLVIERTQQELKARFGMLAYSIAGLQALTKVRPVTYQLELDGEKTEARGLLCTVANSGHLGLPGLSLSPTVNMDDGLLDVIVLRKIDIDTLITLLMQTVTSTRSLGNLQHWQVRHARVAVEPAQSVQVDGDHVGQSPLEVTCLPNSLKVVVPGS